MNAYVFPEFKNPENNIKHEDVYSMLRKVSKRAGITRRIYPHLFRHTRATILASKITEAPLEAQMGWVPGTKQMATYVHLSGKQTDMAILKAYGVEIKDNAIAEPMPVKCPRCGGNESFEWRILPQMLVAVDHRSNA